MEDRKSRGKKGEGRRKVSGGSGGGSGGQEHGFIGFSTHSTGYFFGKKKEKKEKERNYVKLLCSFISSLCFGYKTSILIITHCILP
jgi:hypothetical protein